VTDPYSTLITEQQKQTTNTRDPVLGLSNRHQVRTWSNVSTSEWLQLGLLKQCFRT